MCKFRSDAFDRIIKPKGEQMLIKSITSSIILDFILHLTKMVNGYQLPNSSLNPDQPQVKKPPPSLQITSNFLVFEGLSHDTTHKKKGVAVF